MSTPIIFDGKTYLSAKDAARLTGYTSDYIGQLARAGEFDSRIVGRVRFVDKVALLAYKERLGHILPTELIRTNKNERVFRYESESAALRPEPVRVVRDVSPVRPVRASEPAAVGLALPRSLVKWGAVALLALFVAGGGYAFANGVAPSGFSFAESSVARVSSAVRAGIGAAGGFLGNGADSLAGVGATISDTLRSGVSRASESARGSASAAGRVFENGFDALARGTRTFSETVRSVAARMSDAPARGASLAGRTFQTGIVRIADGAKQVVHGAVLARSNILDVFARSRGLFVLVQTSVSRAPRAVRLAAVSLSPQEFLDAAALSVYRSLCDFVPGSLGCRASQSVARFAGDADAVDAARQKIAERNVETPPVSPVRETTTGATSPTVVERVIERAPAALPFTGLTIGDLTRALGDLRDELSPRIRAAARSPVIGNRGAVSLDDSSIPNDITASNYLPLAGGTLTGALSGTAGSFSTSLGVATTSPSDTLALDGAFYLAQIAAPGVTTNRLYNSSGDLYWAGSVVSGSTVGTWTTDGTDVWRASGQVGIGTTSPGVSLAIDGTDALGLPAGTTGERPGTPLTGYLRYNTTTSQFEGYGGSAWAGLGGVIDVDGDTYILAESSAGADEDALFFYTGGSERARIDSSGNLGLGTTSPYAKLSVVGEAVAEYFTATSTTATSTFAGAVGIGTTSPSVKLELLGDNEVFRIQQDGSTDISQFFSHQNTAGYGWRFRLDNTDADFHLDALSGGTWTSNVLAADISTNRVGVNTNTPVLDLDVRDADGASDTASLGITSGKWLDILAGTAGTGLIFDDSSYFTFGTSNTRESGFPTEIARFTSSGNLGLGTTSPYAKLSVVGEAVAEYFTATSTTATSTFGGGLNVGSGGLVYDYSSGNVGIGTESPASRLHVVGADSDIVLESNLDNGSYGLRWKNNGGSDIGELVQSENTGDFELHTLNGGIGTIMHWDYTAGYVGIGKIPSSAYLDINAAGTGDLDVIKIGNTGSAVGDEFRIKWNSFTWNIGYIGSAFEDGTGSSYLSFGTSNGSNNVAEVARIDSSGNLGLGTTSPYAKLSVVGEAVAEYFTATSTTATSTFGGGLNVGSDGLVYDYSSGNVGIGIAAPLFLFDVNKSSGGQIARFGYTGGNQLNVYSDGTTAGFGTYTNTPLSLWTNNGLPQVTLLTSGNVGIGDTDPDAHLEVSSNGTTGGNIFLLSSDDGNDGDLLTVTEAGYVGILTSSPADLLQVGKSSSEGNYYIAVNASPVHDVGIKFKAGSTGGGAESSKIYRPGGFTDLRVWTTTTGDIVTFQQDGNVGIGTTSPYAKLSVVGEAVAEYFTATSTTATSTFGGGLNVGSGGLVYDYSSGNVGIGANPSYKLDILDTTSGTPVQVNVKNSTAASRAATQLFNDQNYGFVTQIGGSAYAVSALQNVAAIAAQGSGVSSLLIASNWETNTGGSVPIKLVAGGYENEPALTITAGDPGSVGVGTTSPWRTLSVVGTVGFSSTLTSGSTGNYLCINTTNYEVTSGTTCSASSARFKENIKPLAYGLDEVLELNPVFFNYKKEFNPDTSTRVGLIAEEVQKIIPEVVAYDEDGKPEAIQYDKLVSVLIRAMQELTAEVRSGASGAVASVAGAVGDFSRLVVARLTIGSESAPSGITLYDEATGEPYCLSIRNGATRTRAGECADGSNDTTYTSGGSGGDTAPSGTEPETDEATITPEDTATSTPDAVDESEPTQDETGDESAAEVADTAETGEAPDVVSEENTATDPGPDTATSDDANVEPGTAEPPPAEPEPVAEVG